MQRANNSDNRFNGSRRHRSSCVNTCVTTRLHNMAAKIASTDGGESRRIKMPRENSSIGKLILVAAFVVVQVASHEARISHNSDENVIASTQQDVAQHALDNAVGIDVGNVAPDFTLNNLYGTKVNLSDYMGTVVLLEFWASWCLPCNEAIPPMKALQGRYNDKDFIIVAVALDEGTNMSDKLSKFVDEHEINYPVLLHEESVIKTYKVKSIPTTFIIDKHGRIANKYIGLDENNFANAIPSQIERLLQE